MSKKIISVFLIFAISLSMFALPVHAAEGEPTIGSLTGSFWQMLVSSSTDFVQYLFGTVSNIFNADAICPSSPDAKHHPGRVGAGRLSNEVTVWCEYCNEPCSVDDSVLEDAYQDYVADLDVPQASMGKGYVDFSVGALNTFACYGAYGSYNASTGPRFVLSTALFSFFGQFYQRPDSSTAPTDFRSILPDLLLNLDPGRVLVLAILSSSDGYQLVGIFPNEYGILKWGVFENPLETNNSVLFGVYSLSDLTLLESAYSNLTLNDTSAKNDPEYYKRWLVLVDKDFYVHNDYLGKLSDYYNNRYSYAFYGRYKASTSYEFDSAAWYGTDSKGPSLNFASISGLSCLESFDATTRKTIYCPDTTQITFSEEYLVHGPSGTSSSSRPGSVAGNFGTMGDNGTVNNIGNQIIVNESNGTFYNPETGESQTMESWQYDYATRTYNIVTGDGQTVTVTYGNENLTINQGDVTYNIYYMYEPTDTSSGGGSSGNGSGSGDSSGGGIFDKLGELLGTLGGGLVDAIGKAVEFLLDSLLRLARVVVDKGVQLIDLILSFFERIPDMFGAFPQFLAAVFPFMPEEVMIILEFGLAAVVLLGIVKILRK